MDEEKAPIGAGRDLEGNLRWEDMSIVSTGTEIPVAYRVVGAPAARAFQEGNFNGNVIKEHCTRH